MKKLSIIVPVYNAERYLDECISSIRSQHYPDFELIAVDDGSSDRSGSILSRYAEQDERIIVIHQENAGGQVARNVGLRAARGEYIAFVDADDYILPEIYTSLIEQLEAYGADFAFCDMYREGRPHIDAEFFVIEGKQNVVDSIFGCSDMLKCGGYLWNKVYARRYLEGRFLNEKINLGEDGLFNLDIAQHASRIVGTKSTFYYYRINQDSITKTHYRKSAVWERECSEYKRLLDVHHTPELQSYICSRLLDCCVKGAEAVVVEEKPVKELTFYAEVIRKHGLIRGCKNRKTKLQALMLIFSKTAFYILKTRMLNAKKA